MRSGERWGHLMFPNLYVTRLGYSLLRISMDILVVWHVAPSCCVQCSLAQSISSDFWEKKLLHRFTSFYIVRLSQFFRFHLRKNKAQRFFSNDIVHQIVTRIKWSRNWEGIPALRIQSNLFGLLPDHYWKLVFIQINWKKNWIGKKYLFFYFKILYLRHTGCSKPFRKSKN